MSLLVMKHEYIIMNLKEKQNRVWMPKGGNPPQITKKNQHHIRHILQLERNHAAKTMRRGEEHHWVGKRVCAC